MVIHLTLHILEDFISISFYSVHLKLCTVWKIFVQTSNLQHEGLCAIFQDIKDKRNKNRYLFVAAMRLVLNNI